MKRIALSFATVAVMAACSNSAQASDFSRLIHHVLGTNNHAYRHAEQRAHAQHHADLEYRAIDRELVSRAAHRQPLTSRQDVRLHQELDRASYLDDLEHRSAHATRAYSPRYIQNYRSAPYGYGVQNRSSQYGGFPYQPYQVQRQVGCSPYGRY